MTDPETYLVTSKDKEEPTESSHNLIKGEGNEDSLRMPKKCCKRWLSPIKTGSLRGAIFAIACATFGSGSLAFPYAIAQCGLVVGLLIFSFVTICSYFAQYVLIEAGRKMEIFDFNRLLLTCHGKKMVLIYDILNLVTITGCVMSNELICYKFALQIGQDLFGIDSLNKMNLLILIGSCLILFQIPLCFLRNISKLQYSSIVATFALIFTIGVVVVEMPLYLRYYLNDGGEIILFKPVNWGYFDAFATFMFGYSNRNALFPILIELKHPSSRRSHKAVMRSFILVCVLYTLFAFSGYFSTFDKTEDIFILRKDLPGFHDYFIQIAKITLFICLHCGLPIKWKIFLDSLKSLTGFKNCGYWTEIGITLITLLLTNLVVFFTSTVIQIIRPVGGLCCGLIGFIIPVMNYNSAFKPVGIVGIFGWIVMVIFGLGGIGATIRSLLDLFSPIINA